MTNEVPGRTQKTFPAAGVLHPGDQIISVDGKARRDEVLPTRQVDPRTAAQAGPTDTLQGDRPPR